MYSFYCQLDKRLIKQILLHCQTVTLLNLLLRSLQNNTQNSLLNDS